MTTSAAEGARPVKVAHHFESADQQASSGKLGMWIFLSTEILLFGGLFCAYAVYRASHPDIFIYADRFLSKPLGGINTLVLICSSFTMAAAVRASQLGQRKRLIALLGITMFCAFCFLGIKGVEYEQKWKEGLLWGREYSHKDEGAASEGAMGAGGESGASTGTLEGAKTTAAAKPTSAAASTAATTASTATDKPGEVYSMIKPGAEGPRGLAHTSGLGLPADYIGSAPNNVQIFFGIYFIMTGLHALHVIAGILVIGWLLRRSIRGDFHSGYFTPVDLGGLYWHLVDIIWIFLFPLLYLIR